MPVAQLLLALTALAAGCSAATDKEVNIAGFALNADEEHFKPLVTSWLGPIALGCYAFVVFCFLITAWAVRTYRSIKYMAPYEAGSLRYAAATGNVPALRLLSKQKKFDVNAQHDGWTALHSACVTGEADAVAWLLGHGANVEAIKNDEWNDTPLHYAASKGHLRCCQLLVRAGADPEAKNFHGATPADIAGSEEVKAWLEEHKDCAMVPVYDQEGMHSVRMNSAEVDIRCTTLVSNALYDGSAELDDPARAPSGGDSLSLPLPHHVINEDRTQQIEPSEEELKWLFEKRWDSYKAEGTKAYPQLIASRIFCLCVVVIALVYTAWRATRTINNQTTFATIFSVSTFLAELCMLTQFFCSLLLLWQPMTRDDRDMYSMKIPERKWPVVDIFIVTYSEPEYIVEEAIYAALNQQWPSHALHVFVCDDGRRASMADLVRQIQSELDAAGRKVQLTYVGRPKVKGVHHHAKAGNINHTLTKEVRANGDFVLVLDCDMITVPHFLRTCMPHFYETDPKTKKWRLKEKCAMLQVPQRFHNLGPKDPWWHTAEDFNAAGFEGSDGLGGTPCVGTGVIFRKACLTAIGGQSYWSVTEDFKTSSNLLSQGYSTMYLARNLVYGIAVDDIPGIHKQRVRWATGGLEIICQDFPPFRTGLPLAATILFFANAWQYVLSVPAMYLMLGPLVYFFADISPIYTLLLEAAVFLGAFLLATRLLQWWQVRLINIISKDLCLWRGAQQVVWLTPLFLEALVLFVWNKFLSAPFRWCFGALGSPAAFVVSAKDVEGMKWSEVLRASWFIWCFYSFFITGVVTNIAFAATGTFGWSFDLQWWLHFGLGLLLCGYISAMLFPIIAVIMPCIESENKGLLIWVQRDDESSGDDDTPALVECTTEWAASKTINIQAPGQLESVIVEHENAYTTCWGTREYIRKKVAAPDDNTAALETMLKQKYTVYDASVASKTSSSTADGSSPNAIATTPQLQLQRARDRAPSKLARYRSNKSLADMLGDESEAGGSPQGDTPASGPPSTSTDTSRKSKKTRAVKRVPEDDEALARHLEAFIPGLHKRPRFHLPPYVLHHYKFRLVFGIMIACCCVALPCISVIIYDDRRFLKWLL